MPHPRLMGQGGATQTANYFFGGKRMDSIRLRPTPVASGGLPICLPHPPPCVFYTLLKHLRVSRSIMSAPMASSEFMLQLHKQLVDEKKVAESTASAYIRTLYILNGKKPFKTLTFLKDISGVPAQIEKDYAESTQKTLYSALTSVLSLVKDKGAYKKVYQFYYDKMMAKAKDASEADTAEKSEKQEANWIGWDEVEKTANELRQKALAKSKSKVLGVGDWDALLHSVVLSLYVYTPPRRNQDYLDMSIVRLGKKEKVDDLAKDKNWLVIHTKEANQFIFNKYKTSKTYGQQKVAIPNTSDKPLGDVLAVYLAHHPGLKDKKAKECAFLVDASGNALTAPNAITRILNKVFGKAIGSSMLRHIYLSAKYDITEMKADATAMAHSVNQQKEYLKHPPPPAEAEPSPDSASAPSTSGTPPQTAEAHTAPPQSALPQDTPSQPLESPPAPRSKKSRKVAKPSTSCPE